MIKATNPQNYTIAGVAVNGDARVRVTIPPGQTANIDGNKALPGIIPEWVWNSFRDSAIGTNYIKSGALVVEGDLKADDLAAEYRAKIAEEEKQAKQAKLDAAKAAKEAAKKTKTGKSTPPETPEGLEGA